MRSIRWRAMRKYVGFGRLYGIVRDIFIVPETVVPDSMEGRLILISSGFVSFVKYFWILSDARFLLIFLWRPSNLISDIM